MQMQVATNVEQLPLEEAERSLRIQLAAAYRIVDYFNWNELIYGHLTVRVPGPRSWARAVIPSSTAWREVMPCMRIS